MTEYLNLRWDHEAYEHEGTMIRWIRFVPAENSVRMLWLRPKETAESEKKLNYSELDDTGQRLSDSL